MAKTSTYDRETLLLAHIMQWIIQELNGRYREHVSDKFLAHVLLNGVRSITYPSKPTGKEHMEHPFTERDQIAYASSCPIFEQLLEHACRAGGNGHHVAQDFAKCIAKFTVSPLQ
mgnify:CR=1 FL=1